MPTSDIFKTNRPRKSVLYRAIGPGFNIPFMSSVLYNAEDAEIAAIERAINIGGRLEKYDEDRSRFVAVYSPRGGYAVLPEIDTNAGLFIRPAY
jgi:hypothetical protein